jgi:2-polyprenyl-3-methyl-5-hydroxy-6-metoxy-1,4-benzoquinol methylase
MQVKDHFLSKEDFNLTTCEECLLLFTNPRPDKSRISDYYKSEDYVSHSSSKKGLVNRVYNQVRTITLNKKFRLIDRISPGKRLLDIGAGSGHFVGRMKIGGFDVVGLEPDQDARRVCAELNGFELDSLERLYDDSLGIFDVVTMWHVLEHVYDLQADLERISALVKPGGVFVVAVPNFRSYDATHYQSYWAAYDVPRHLYHFEPASIIPMIQKCGFDHQDTLPMKFDSYYVSMLSEKYKGGSLLKALWIGWLSNLRSSNGKCSSQIYIFKKK